VSLTFSEYAEAAGRTAVYPNRGNNLIYPTLGLCGESGEVAEKVKKVLRDADGKVSDAVREALVLELGDALWYVAAVAFELGVTMEDVAERNKAKLASRQAREKLKGSGDER